MVSCRLPSLCHYRRLCVRSSPTQPALSSTPTSQAQNLTPERRSETGRKLCARRKPPSPLPSLPPSGGSPLRSPRHGERTEPARTPADELAAPSIARCGSGQVSLRPPTALPHSPGSQGSPAGSGFALLLPAPPVGLPLCAVPAWGALDCGRRRCEERVAQPGPGSSRDVLPIRCFPSLARGGLVSRKRQFSLRFASAQHCPTWSWRQTGTEAALSLEF